METTTILTRGEFVQSERITRRKWYFGELVKIVPWTQLEVLVAAKSPGSGLSACMMPRGAFGSAPQGVVELAERRNATERIIVANYVGRRHWTVGGKLVY